MAVVPAQLSLMILNNRPEIRSLRNRFDSFAEQNDLPGSITRDVQLALDELLTNIVDYGYEDDKDHTIEVEFELTENSLSIRIIDDAKPYNIFDKADPDTSQSIDEKPVGGLGIYLVKRLMTEVKYEYRGGKNQVTLIKGLTHGDSD